MSDLIKSQNERCGNKNELNCGGKNGRGGREGDGRRVMGM